MSDPKATTNNHQAPIDGIGKALNSSSNVSFTISEGMINTIYFPREDTPCTRELQLIITDGKEYFSDEKEHTHHEIRMENDGVPAYHIMNGCKDGHYALEKEIITDPIRNVVLQQVQFQPVKDYKKDYHLFALLEPHLNNTAWVDEYKGVPMMFAYRDGLTIAFACSYPWKKRSVAVAGTSDALADLEAHKQMTHEHQHAENDCVVLAGQIDMSLVEDTFLLAIGFGKDKDEAGLHVWSSLVNGFSEAKQFYMQEWENWQGSLSHQAASKNGAGKLFRTSAAILRMHEVKNFPGAVVSGIPVPDKEDHHPPAYQQVWVRDLVESAEAFFAAGAGTDGQRILNYLTATQEADGSWPQSMWLSGSKYNKGIQLDEIALPALLIDLCKTKNVLHPDILFRYAVSVQKAAEYLIASGGYTQQDRWQEQAGYSPYTLAAIIAALLTAADFAKKNNDPVKARYYEDNADYLNEKIEYLTYVTGTSLAKEAGVDGYYIRINPYKDIPAKELQDQKIHIGKAEVPVNEMISTDALALVRYGLRAPDDPRILNTIKVIDKLLKVERPEGPSWHRYNAADNGNEYDQTGSGGAWPLLTGERAHYEIAAGHMQKARSLIKTMESFTHHGLFPKQIWNKQHVSEEELTQEPVMPLLWAQAEYVKLCVSLRLKKVYDMPEHTFKRYQEMKKESKLEIWRFEQPCTTIPKTKKLRLEVKAPATVHYSMNGWNTVKDIEMADTGTGLHIADLPKMRKKGTICFTFYWKKADRWEGKNFKVAVQ